MSRNVDECKPLVSGAAAPHRLPARAAEVHAVAWLPPEYTKSKQSVGTDAGADTGADMTAVLAAGGRERAVTLWAGAYTRPLFSSTQALSVG